VNPSAVADAELAFLSAAAAQDHDPDVLADRLRVVVPVSDFSQIGGRSGFVHRSVMSRAGDITIVAGAHTPLFGSVRESPLATVLLPLAGRSTYWIDGRVLEGRGANTALFLPGQAYRAQTDTFNGAIFSVDPESLARTAAVMAGANEAETNVFAEQLQQPRQLDRAVPQQGELISNLEQTLKLLDLQSVNGPGLATVLRLDDVIRRCLALLLLPSLQESTGESSTTQAQNRRRLDALEDYLHAHLTAALSLTDLEAWSGLSRRSLQHAFQQRHGCGPMQWLRRQRLIHARDRLLHPHPGDTVQGVAAAFGYANLSAFSRDFRDVFDCRPSELLRQGFVLVSGSGSELPHTSVDRPGLSDH
jgi:AraC-like DNA-binding protein